MKTAALAMFGVLALSACEPANGTQYSHVMDISNGTSVTMTHFYASPTQEDNWGRDHLGNSVLKSGTYTTFDFEDGTGRCYYDFRAEFADGDAVVDQNIDVCAETGWDYFDT